MSKWRTWKITNNEVRGPIFKGEIEVIEIGAVRILVTTANISRC